MPAGTIFGWPSGWATVFTVWSEWEVEKCEQFDARWPTVQAVLSALENLGIYVVDVSPSNIAFLDRG
jgi:hypothetical protein